MINNNRILAIVPARGGSKGIPRKNLRLFQGQSLLARTIESTKCSLYIDRIVVSSEDAEIIAEAKRAGADVPFVRPTELAQDHTSGVDPVLHALSQLEHYDYVVLLQVTSPLRTTQDIDACLEYCFQQNAPACVSVVEVDQHPYWMVTMSDGVRLKKFYSGDIPARRQDLPEIFGLNGAIYIAKTDWLMQTKSFLADETIGFIMPKERSLDIDTELDFKILEACTTAIQENK